MNRYLGLTFGTVLCGLLALSGAFGQTATLLPNAIQNFLDNNGKPLANGKVYFYVPNTTTPKTTWTSNSESVAQPQPVPLGISGRPASPIYGDGIYRQVVKDQFNNTIWDFVTASTDGGSGPTPPTPTVGDGNIVGTILPWAGLVAPPNYVFAYGQAISRTAYPLFTSTVTIITSLICTNGLNVLSGISDTSQIRIGAPVEATCIPPGTTVTAVASTAVTVSANASTSTATSATFFPYGNGDGATTLNVPDFRGQVLAGRNNMGGTAGSNLTSTYFGTSPNAIGAPGGSQSKVLQLTDIPAGIVSINSGGSIPLSVVSPVSPAVVSTTGGFTSSGAGGGSAGQFSGSANQSAGQVTSTGTIPISSFTVTSQNTGTPSQTTLSLIQPTTTMNYVIKVLPDVSSTVATGVASLGGMTGVIACGAGLTCNSQTVSVTSPIVSTDSVTYVAPFTGSQIENQTAYNAERVSITDFGAIPGTSVANAATNANAIAKAIATGKQVYIPYPGTSAACLLSATQCGYNFGNFTTLVPSGTVISCENSQTIIYGQGNTAAQPVFYVSGNAQRGFITNCVGQMGINGIDAVAGSTFVRFATAQAPVNQFTVQNIHCQFVQECVGDESFSITASISGSILTVTALPAGTALGVGSRLVGTGVPVSTAITALGSGTGGTGTYTINNSLTVSSETMTAQFVTSFVDMIGIYTTSTYGRQFHLGYSNGFINLTRLNCDFSVTALNVPAAWSCGRFSNGVGIFVNDWISVTNAGTGSVYNSAIVGWEFDNVTRLVGTTIKSDSVVGDGCLFKNVNAVTITNLDCGFNLGTQASFTASDATTGIAISNASPAIVTWAGHGFSAYQPVYFTGSTPSGLSPNVIYYVVAGASITANSFEVSATPGGAALNTSASATGLSGFSASSDIQISNALIYGGNANAAASKAGLVLNGVTNVNIAGTDMFSLTGDALQVSGPSTNVNISNHMAYNNVGNWLTVGANALHVRVNGGVNLNSGGGLSNAGTDVCVGFVVGVNSTCLVPLGNISGLGTGVFTALSDAVNSSGGIVSPTPTRAGDVIYWNGSAWTSFAGNNSGSNCLQENASGVPSWFGCGAGTVTSIATTSPITGGTITTTGTLACPTCVTSAAALTLNSLVIGGGLQASATTTTGTGVVTALGVNTGTAGAFVVNGGGLGTPTSGVATNLTGTAASLTAGNVTTNANLTGAVTSSGNATSLGSFSSANLSGALTDETGSGAAVFGTSPILSTVDARGTWTTGTSWTLPTHQVSVGALSNLAITATTGLANPYSSVSLNNTAAAASTIGIFGNATADTAALYLAAPTTVSLFTATQFVPAVSGTANNGTNALSWLAVYSNTLIAKGSAPTGSTGTCTTNPGSFSGGTTAGKFTVTCTAQNIILTGLPTAPTGYTCSAWDQTTPANLIRQTANSVTSVTFAAVTTGILDTIVFDCRGW